jgi:hypothetical protein
MQRPLTVVSQMSANVKSLESEIRCRRRSSLALQGCRVWGLGREEPSVHDRLCTRVTGVKGRMRHCVETQAAVGHR